MRLMDLKGEALDKAVQKALLPIAMRGTPQQCWDPAYAPPPLLPYSTDWAAGGPLIERFGISLVNETTSMDSVMSRQRWTAYVFDDPERIMVTAHTALEAAMFYVVSKFGGSEYDDDYED